VVLTPRRWRQVRGVKSAQPGLDKNISAERRWQRARSPGRARRKPLKPLRAGTPGDAGVLVVTRVRSTTTSAHEAAGATGIRRSPRPLRGERFMHNSGASRRGVANVCLEFHVIASEATQSIRRHSGAMRSIEPGISRFRVWSCGPSRNDGVWIASRSLSSGAIRATRLLRNDGWLFETRIRLLPQGLVAKA
jgi:hypothetical protein